MKVNFSFANFIVQPQKISTSAQWQKIGLIFSSFLLNIVTLGSINYCIRRYYPESLNTRKIDDIGRKSLGVNSENVLEKEGEIDSLIQKEKENLTTTYKEIPREESALIKYIETTLPSKNEAAENAQNYPGPGERIEGKDLREKKGNKIKENFFRTVQNLDQAKIGDYEILGVDKKAHKIMKIKRNKGDPIEILIRESTLSTQTQKFYRIVVSDGRETRWSSWAFTAPQLSVMTRTLREGAPEGFRIASRSLVTLAVSGLLILKEEKTGSYFLVNEKGALQKVENGVLLSQHIKSCDSVLRSNK